ncbi:MAG: DODA-type extradiol aromatic ring-opening family dioxygenase [Rhodoferax sp.]
MALAPALFISHGAPTLAIEPSRLGPALHRVGQNLSAKSEGAGIRAVLVVSPHWQTRGVKVMSTAAPETVHDFGGFPSELYAIQYPAKGHPELAAQTRALLAQAGWPVSDESRRGLDHGAWVPLLYLLPDAAVPVFQVSMPHDLTTASALALGQALAPLRAQGVMVVGSGSMTHNLYEFRQGSGAAADYAIEFTHWVRQRVQANDLDALVDYRARAPHAERAHPTEEHFLPLLLALGAGVSAGSGADLTVIDGGVDNGVLAMESYGWGLSN